MTRFSWNKFSGQKFKDQGYTGHSIILLCPMSALRVHGSSYLPQLQPMRWHSVMHHFQAKRSKIKVTRVVQSFYCVCCWPLAARFTCLNTNFKLSPTWDSQSLDGSSTFSKYCCSLPSIFQAVSLVPQFCQTCWIFENIIISYSLYIIAKLPVCCRAMIICCSYLLNRKYDVHRKSPIGPFGASALYFANYVNSLRPSDAYMRR